MVGLSRRGQLRRRKARREGQPASAPEEGQTPAPQRAQRPAMPPPLPPERMEPRLKHANPDMHLYSNYLDIYETLGRYFVSRTPLLTCGGKAFKINDIVAAAILSNTNLYLIGSRGSGKTLLSEAIMRGIFNSQGLYLRGDVHLTLKDLFMKINLHGKTDEEIYQIAEAIKYAFALVDELNRVPGIVQNQFLNLMDGYIEIRGMRIPLGVAEYMFTVATGNPPTNGEYTGVFDEDLALLDRIPLIINVDEVKHARGDVARILEMNMDKTSIQDGDLTDDVIASYSHLVKGMTEDPEMTLAMSLLAEVVYDSFRHVKTADGKEIDKCNVPNWRDVLPGEHAGGNTISYVSDVSVRTLVRAYRLGFAIYKIAGLEAELVRSRGMPVAPMEMSDFLDSYFGALKLALTYDRRFIPADLPKSLNKTHAEVLDGAFTDLRSIVDSESFEDAGVALGVFFEALKAGDVNEMQGLIQVASSVQDNPLMGYARGIMDSKVREREEKQKIRLLREALGEV